MLFSSVIFIFLFLPITLIGYYLIRKEFKNLFLLAFSLFFYAWGEPKYIIIMLLSVCINYGMVILISEYRKVRWLILAIAINLTLLVFFKYLNFILSTLSILIPIPRYLEFSNHISLPIGISFFTFQAMSYCIDVYQGKVTGQHSLTKVALYISFFPQLIAGPIIRYIDISREIDERNETFDNLLIGIKRFIIGLSKKVLIANVLAQSADRAFSAGSSELVPIFAIIGIMFYALQIYFDFSGYSDMAIGLGRMFGFNFLENFNHPYSALSIRDFWRRWHISLSSWFRDYLYLPLGGNRKGDFRTGLNLMLVFLLCGLWHGANWTFVLWGLWHGLFLVLERTPFGTLLDKFPVYFRILYTLLIVSIGWIFFRADSVPHAFQYIGSIFNLHKTDTHDHIMNYLNNEIYLSLIFAVFISSEKFKNRVISKIKYYINDPFYIFITNISLLILFYFSISKLALGTYNPFIYFRF